MVGRGRRDDKDSGRPRAPLPVLGSTRTRLFVAYLTLLGGTGLIAVFGIPALMRLRLEGRTDAALDQEIEEISLYLDVGRDPDTGLPFTDIERLFDTYLDRNVPSIEEGFATYVDGTPGRDRLRSFPGNVLPDDVVEMWAARSATPRPDGSVTRGRFDTPRGTAEYAALDVSLGGSNGLFVVTILPEAGRREIRELQTFGTAVMLGAVVAGGAGAWWFTGRLLRPMRELTDTARAISEPGVARRARVGGSPEASRLAGTFNEMLDRLDAASESQLEFVQAVGHELRAPLTVAIGHLELASEDVDAREALPLVLDELARMGRILDDLQALAIVERPDFIQPEVIEATDFAIELLAKSRAMAPRAWQLADGRDGGAFVADRHRLTEAALNLVDNAVKSTTDTDTIAIGVRRCADEVAISVRDSGAGIAMQDLERVRRRFERGGDAKQRYRGAGLGLSLVESIAVAHGGRLELESEPGRGTCARIVIPHVPPAREEPE